MEVALSFAVSDLVEHNLRFNCDSGRFTYENSLESLEHLQDVDGVHTAVLIVIAQLEHN